MIGSFGTKIFQSFRFIPMLALVACVAPAVAQTVQFDQDATPDVINGSGNANGAFTTDRRNDIEIAIRGKLRFNDSGLPENTFNSNGDGSYSFDAIVPPTRTSPTAEWSFDWSVNADYTGLAGRNLDELIYEMGLDGDPGVGTDFLTWDPIIPPDLDGVTLGFDHAIGDNTTGNGAGTSLSKSSPTFEADYAALIANNNVAQNSWRYDFFNFAGTALENFDPTVNGRYAVYIQAMDPVTNEVLARSYIQILAGDAPKPATVYVDADFDGANLGDTVQFTMPGGATVDAVFGVDAFAELQNGVDAVDENGTVQAASGDVFDLTIGLPLEINTLGVTLTTDPADPATIQYVHNDFFPVIEVFEENATIENFVIRRENPASAGQAIAIRRSGATLRELDIIGVSASLVAAVTIDHGLPSAYDIDADSIFVENNSISGDFAWGFGLATRSADAQILGATIRNNTIDGAANGVFFFNSGGTPTGIQNIDYSNNTHVNLTGNTLLFQNLSVLDPAQFLAGNSFEQAVRIVGQLSIYQNIQTAINVATAGQTVILESDIVEGLVALDKAITLDGNGFTLTSLSPNFGVSIQSLDATIENLVVDGAGTFGIHQSPGSDNLVIRGTTVQNGGGTGFAMNCSNNILLQNISAFDNGGNGVSITNCTDVVIDGITTSGNQFTTFSAGIGIFSNASTCLPDGTDNVQITGTVNIAEPVPYYEQATTGTITNVTAPAGLATHLVGFGAAGTVNFISLQDAIDFAVAAIASDPAVQPVTFLQEIATGNLYVADSMAIQAAIDAADPGVMIEVLAGQYPESILIDKAGLILRGAGADVPTGGRIRGSGAESVIDAQDNPRAVGIAASNVTFAGFSVTSTAGVIRGVGETTSVTGTQVADNFIYGFPGSIGVNVAAGSSGTQVRGNDITDAYAGIYLSANASGTTVSGNVVSSLAAGAGPDQGSAVVFEGNNTAVSVTGNELTGNAFGIYLFDLGSDLSGTLVSQNVIVGNSSGITNTNTSELEATCNWWGDADGPGGEGPGTGDSVTTKVVFEPWQTSAGGTCDGFIDPVVRQSDGRQFGDYSSALADAGTLAGDTLTGSAKTYTESFTLDKAVSLAGAGSADTVIAGQVEITSAGVSGSPIQISNLGISNPGGNGVLLSSGAAFIEFDSVSLSNNGGSGINVNPNPAQPLIEGITIRGSNVSNNGSAGIRPSSNSYLVDWLIESSNINGNANTGFLSAGGAGAGTFRIDGLSILNSVFIGNGGLDASPFGGAIWLKTTEGPDSFINDVLIQGNLFADNGSSNPANRFAITYQVRPDASSAAVVINNNTFQSTSTGGTQVIGVKVFDQTGGFGYRPAQITNNAFVQLAGAQPVIAVFGELSLETGYAVAAMSGNSFMGDVTLSEQISDPIQRISDGELFSTFASAIADAGTADGDELRAGTGLYAGNFAVDKGVIVSGTGPDSVITGDPLVTGTPALNVGIDLPNGRDGVTIRDLRVEDVAGNCIFGRLGNNDTLIERVEVNACQAAGAGGGIYFNGPVDGITITESIVSNSTTRGIVIWNGFKTNITITDNEVTGNNCCGIELQDGTASGVTITGNLVTGNGDNGIGVVGLTSGAGPNRIADNTVTDNGRFGIEIKLPNGTGGLDELADGAIVVANNTVALTGGINALNPTELRDLAGIAVFRRGIADADNVDLPRGVTVRNNTVNGYLQNNAGSTSDGFGIVVEGVQMRVESNQLADNDVGLQRQSGHLPYVPHEPGTDPTDPPQQDGDQGNLDDDFFGRGNAQQVCAITDANAFTNNGVDSRDVIQAGPGNADPIAINQDRDTFYCLIQTGIDDALAGETLEVLPGSYTEQLVVDRAMTLLGDSSGIDRPVLGFDQTAADANLPALVRVQSADVTIDGFEFDVDMSWVGQGIRTEGDASGLQVLHNRFVSRYSGQAGPIGFGDRNAIFVNPVGRPQSVGGGFGGVLISNNEIAVNRQSGTFTDFFRAGLAMDTATGSLVGNDILAATHDAIIRFTLGGSLVVDGNTFRGGGLQLAEFNATGPVSVSGNQFMPDNAIGFGTVESPTTSSIRLQNNTNAIPVTVGGNSFADHTTGIRAENFPALTIENNGFDPYVGATSYRHIVVTNRVNVSNFIAPLEVDAAIAGNTFNGGAAGGTAVEFSNLNCCDAVGSGTTTATFGALVVGGANPNAFAGDLDRYIVLDGTSGLVDFGLAQTEAQPFFADINAVGNIWDGVAGSAQSEAERSATRAKIIDSEDNPDLGQVILEEPELAVAPESIDFGSVQVGSTTSPQQVVYTNNGQGVLEFELALPSAPFAVDGNACGNGTVVLQPSESCSVGYTFAPGAVNSFVETVIYTSNDPAGNRSLALEGVGIAAAAPATTPASHDFAGVVVDQNASFEFTIENAGDPLTSLTLQAPTVSGDASFSVSGGTCASGTVLAGGQACTVTVEFAPTQTGNVSGSLDIGSNAGNVSAGLSGEGLAPAELQISPASTDFGAVLVTEPATTTFTLINAGDPITTITLDAPALAAGSDAAYSLVGGSCASGTELIGGDAGCTVEVQFAPTLPNGPLTGSVEVASDFNTVAASLEGSGELPDWSDAFANPDAGSGGFEQDWTFQAFDATLTPIIPQTAQVTNDAYLQIRDPNAAFALGYVERSFNDTRTSALVNADGFGSGSDSGDGLDNQIDQGVIGRFDPATLSGYAAYMRMELDTQELVLIKFDSDNVDPALVDLRDTVATSADPDWALGRMYEVELDLVDQPGGSVLVVARALDADTGTLLSRLEFEDPAVDAFGAGFSGVLAIANATGLNGTFDTTAAQSSFASADLDPQAIDFGTVQVGTADQQVVTLANDGNTPLAISNIAIDGAAAADYTLQGDSCGASLPAGDSCSFEIAFVADATGQRSAEVVIQTSASTSPDVILLDAEVFQAALAIDPVEQDFGSVLVGQSSAATTFTVSNTGDPVTSLALTSVNLSGDFSRTGGDCTDSTSLNGGESCTVDVVFAPQSVAPLVGSLEITSDLGVVSADLQGQGLEAAALSIDPLDHDFGAVTIGSTATFEFTLANTGDPTSQLQLGAISILGNAAFTVTGGTCQASTSVLAGQTDCTVEVQFAPTVLGGAGGTLNVESDAGEVNAGLAGLGTDVAALSIDQASFDFGTVLIGDSASAGFVLTNTGGAASSLTLQSLDANGADFTVTGGTCTLGTVLGSADECTVTVEFAPSVPGAIAGALDIGSDAGPVQAQLSGTGISEINLRITGSASPDPAIAGANVVYALTVDNLSSIGDATGVTVESTLPPGTSLVGSAGCVEPQGVPTCTIGGLAAGDSSQVSLTVFVPSGLTDDLDFSAVVSSDQDDPNPGNDSTAISTSLAFQSDLAAVIEPVTEFIPATDNQVQFVLLVSNFGPSDATGASVASELGTGLVDIGWTCEAGAGATCVDASGTGDVAGLVDMGTGSSATFTINAVLADPSSDQEIISSGIVVEPAVATDPDIANNEDETAIRTGIFADGFESQPIP